MISSTSSEETPSVGDEGRSMDDENRESENDDLFARGDSSPQVTNNNELYVQSNSGAIQPYNKNG